uniref:Capsid protein n=1 Tax=Grus japonensis Chaphamaparvovirus TaxID=2794490 RepID=A0A8A4XEA8_9VIRU|nr:MAG: capsid protein [Grus japonensis Chaphamaparvovirus]
MAETFTVSHNYMAYINNKPMQYPNDDHQVVDDTVKYRTGWQLIPNMLFAHYFTPKDWLNLMTNYEAYTVAGITATVYNMVPMSTQLAIGGQSIFTAFNNCIYAMGYTDKHYETPWFPWLDPNNMNYNPNLIYKEGRKGRYNQNDFINYSLPEYEWTFPRSYTSTAETWAMNNETGTSTWPQKQKHPSGLHWDPLNEPSEIMELRPGKNAMSYSWNPHPCDEGKWYNLDGIATIHPWTATGPYNAKQRPQTWRQRAVDDPNELSSQWQTEQPTNDYTIPNLALQPIVPCNWWWKEMQQSIIIPDVEGARTHLWKMTDLLYPGTEKEMWHYPPTQWFLKMIPLFTQEGTLVEMHANVSIKVELTLKVKKRRSAIFCPTQGPFPWRSFYSAKSLDRNFFPSLVRARTGGMRRTWQNEAFQLNRDNHTPTSTGHWREVPYTYEANLSDNFAGRGTGIGGTYTATMKTTQADTNKDKITVTFSKEMERVVIHTPMETEPQPTTSRQPDVPYRKPKSRALSPGLLLHTHKPPGNIHE